MLGKRPPGSTITMKLGGSKVGLLVTPICCDELVFSQSVRVDYTAMVLGCDTHVSTQIHYAYSVYCIHR